MFFMNEEENKNSAVPIHQQPPVLGVYIFIAMLSLIKNKFIFLINHFTVIRTKGIKTM